MKISDAFGSDASHHLETGFLGSLITVLLVAYRDSLIRDGEAKEGSPPLTLHAIDHSVSIYGGHLSYGFTATDPETDERLNMRVSFNLIAGSVYLSDGYNRVGDLHTLTMLPGYQQAMACMQP
jgi:hypothetical protein